MTVQLEDVKTLVAAFGEVLRVRESDAYLLGSGPMECLEVLLKIRKGVKPTSLMMVLRARGYSVELVRLRGREAQVRLG